MEEISAIEKALLSKTRLYARILSDETLTSEDRARFTQSQSDNAERISTLEATLTTAVPAEALTAIAAAIVPEDRTRLSDLPAAKEHAKALSAHQADIATLARLKYDSGDYAGASAYMKVALKLGTNGASSDAAAYSQVGESLLWGGLATFVLSGLKTWAVFVANRLAERIDSQSRGAAYNGSVDLRTILKSRVWLLHWAAFAFFLPDEEAAAAAPAENGDENAPVAFVSHQQCYFDFVFGNERLFNAVKLAAPHLLRYVAAAAVLVRRKRMVAHFEAALRQEAYRYEDVVTELVGDVISGSDAYSERADVFLRCERVMEDDYFLRAHKANFLENARIMLLDVYVKTSAAFSDEFLRKKLAFASREDAAQWVEKRNLPLAKEARETGEVVFSVQTSATSNYHQMIAKYRAMFYKTRTLGTSIAEIGHPAGEGANNAQMGGNNNNNGPKGGNNNKKMRK